MINIICFFLLLPYPPKTVEEETYSVYLTDTSPQKMGMKVGEPFYYAFEKYKILELKEDGEITLVKWKEKDPITR